MKAEELQVGDYVKIKDSGKEIQLTCVDGSYDTADYFDADAEGELTVELRKLESIPLTKDFLKKNGFKEFGLIDRPKYGLWLGDGRMIELSEIDEGWRILMFYNNIPMSLNYIHQLQHVFRLCGIDRKFIL